MNFNILSTTQYNSLTYRLIRTVEEERATAYIDSNGLATIGVGFLMLWRCGRTQKVGANGTSLRHRRADVLRGRKWI